MPRSHPHGLENILGTNIGKRLPHHVYPGCARPARKNQDARGRSRHKGVEFFGDIRKPRGRTHLAPGGGERDFQKTAERIPNLAGRGHTKGNNLVPREGTPHRNVLKHGKLVKTIDSQECRALRRNKIAARA